MPLSPDARLVPRPDVAAREIEDGAVLVNMSVTVNVVVPEGALSALRRSPAEFAEELMRAAVAKWYISERNRQLTA